MNLAKNPQAFASLAAFVAGLALFLCAGKAVQASPFQTPTPPAPPGGEACWRYLEFDVHGFPADVSCKDPCDGENCDNDVHPFFGSACKCSVTASNGCCDLYWDLSSITPSGLCGAPCEKGDTCGEDIDSLPSGGTSHKPNCVITY